MDIETFKGAYVDEWDVYDYGQWLLVDDRATTTWYRREAIEEAEDLREMEYSQWCEEVVGYKDEAVPPSILVRAREEQGLGDQAPVAWGW